MRNQRQNKGGCREKRNLWRQQLLSLTLGKAVLDELDPELDQIKETPLAGQWKKGRRLGKRWFLDRKGE